MHGLFHLRGKEHLAADKLVAGDLAAVAKLGDTATGSTLAPKDSPVRVAPPTRHRRSFGLALKPLTQSDDDKLSGALQRLLAEDPALVVERNEETGQTVLRGIGDTHLAVALERLARKFGVNVETEDVRVPYRETITGSAEAEGRSRSSPAVTASSPSPTCGSARWQRGDGIEFVNSIVGGTIPKQYIPAVPARRRGDDGQRRRARVPRRRRARRVLRRQVPLRRLVGHGVPLGRRPRAQGGAPEGRRGRARADLELTVTVPEGDQGDVLGDLNGRRGRVSGTPCSATAARDRRPRARPPRSSATPSSCAR